MVHSMFCISGQPGTYGTFGLDESNQNRRLPEYPPYVGLNKKSSFRVEIFM